VIEIEQADASWLETLPNSARVVLGDLLQKGSTPEDAIALWIGGSRDSRISPMGGVGGPQKREFTELFYKELHLLICTNDQKYKSVRDQFPKINKASLTTATGVVTAALAPYLGMATALIGPAVVLAFIAIGKVGLQAWCASKTG
jgi:hypothetical protein